MIPTFLITFREVIEASLIVVTILGILTKLNQIKGIKTVWYATLAAILVSVLFLVIGSLLGLKVQELYSGKIEKLIEGILMMVSSIFITWAVFFLHKYFSRFKEHLIKKVKDTVEKDAQKGLFILVFTAVFREGFEIVLFLTTIYISSNPQSILIGFMGGIIGGLLVSFGLFKTTLRLPVYLAFKVTSILLILFAGGLLIHGIHEFTEVGIFPEIGKITFALLPEKTSFSGQMLQTIFGLTKNMNIIQISAYCIYVLFMSWYVFIKKKNSSHIIGE